MREETLVIPEEPVKAPNPFAEVEFRPAQFLSHAAMAVTLSDWEDRVKREAVYMIFTALSETRRRRGSWRPGEFYKFPPELLEE